MTTLLFVVPRLDRGIHSFLCAALDSAAKPALLHINQFSRFSLSPPGRGWPEGPGEGAIDFNHTTNTPHPSLRATFSP